MGAKGRKRAKKAPAVAEAPAKPKTNIGARSAGVPLKGSPPKPPEEKPAPHQGSQGAPL